jgi:nitroreductase
MIEEIKKRVSTRTFKDKPLSEHDRLFIEEVLQEANQQTGPFGHKVRFFFVDNGTTRQTKIGTYGFIKNPPSFIGGVVENSKEGMIDFGFLMEHVILRLTAHDLGTVWLGGTYHRKDFQVEVGDNEIIAAVSPVGYPTKRSLRERIIRTASKGNSRKPFDTLFFSGFTLQTMEETNPLYSTLQHVQIAPSASNKQPWRIVLDDSTFHVYLKRTPGYGNALRFDIQAIDIGIALSHLVLSLQDDGYHPKFESKEAQIQKDWIYITSVRI